MSENIMHYKLSPKMVIEILNSNNFRGSNKWEIDPIDQQYALKSDWLGVTNLESEDYFSMSEARDIAELLQQNNILKAQLCRKK